MPDVTSPGTASLVIVGTGIQWGGQTTLAAQRAIESADRVLFAVTDPWTAGWVRQLNPGAESLSYPHEAPTRRHIYVGMAERIVEELRKGLRVCAVFYGHPGVLADPAHLALRQARQEGFPARMLPGVSSLDCLFADLGVDPGREGCQLYEATEFLVRGRSVDARTPLILCQIGSIGITRTFDTARPEQIRHGLSVLGEVLLQHYPATHQAIVYEASAHPLEPPRNEPVALGSLADIRVSDISSLYIPPLAPAPLDVRMAARLGMALPE